MGCGCDLNHASLTLEAQGLVAAGFTPMEAIQAATRLNAEICRAPEVGMIEAGALADLVAVKGDPLQELERLDDVVVVVKAGVLVVDERSGSASLRPRVTWPASPRPEGLVTDAFAMTTRRRA